MEGLGNVYIFKVLSIVNNNLSGIIFLIYVNFIFLEIFDMWVNKVSGEFFFGFGSLLFISLNVIYNRFSGFVFIFVIVFNIFFFKFGNEGLCGFLGLLVCFFLSFVLLFVIVEGVGIRGR